MTYADLKLDPVHGLNTSDELCFWCSKKTGRKVIHGLREDGQKAPESHYRDYTPCKNCGGSMQTGITFIQCSTTANNNKAVDGGLYPTGVWVVLSEAWVREVFKEATADKIILDKAVHIPMELWERLKLPNIINEGVESHILSYKETVINPK